MKSTMTCAALLLAAVPAIAAFTSAGHAQEAIRSGLWQFTSEGVQQQPGGKSFTNCLDPARSVPIDPSIRCNVEGMNRNGTAVSWVTTCSVEQGTFRSQGMAQYRGDTMAGTLTTEVPVLGGQMSQRISGRYLGPCRR